MFAVVVCERFGWTYYQYLDQPRPFLDLIKEKMKIDAQKEQQASNSKQH